MGIVTMTCMTTKDKFDVENPEVVVLKNNRYAYRAPCPWQGKDGRDLTAFKFASKAAFGEFSEREGKSASEEGKETSEEVSAEVSEEETA
tara:strand:+ start:79 stop:348 length:270 start_codon:yes stop_codon:yes gene_type:complete